MAANVRAVGVVESGAGAAAADPIADVVRIFIGNGTATHPDAGLLVGNGYSWTAQSCPGMAPCTGGRSGLIGNGGAGFNGGAGGSAGASPAASPAAMR